MYNNIIYYNIFDYTFTTNKTYAISLIDLIIYILFYHFFYG